MRHMTMTEYKVIAYLFNHTIDHKQISLAKLVFDLHITYATGSEVIRNLESIGFVTVIKSGRSLSLSLTFKGLELAKSHISEVFI
jgi:DNA-binding MarR family transcriptional regulator